MEKLTELVKRINNIREDIRAEVIVSDLLASGIHEDDILIRFIGQLERPRSRDIARVRVVQNSKSRNQLEIILNRDSIYDMLPEGMFHQPSAKNQSISVPAMVEEYHQHQQEEEEVRQFFAPFENELFLQRTYTESEEFQQLFQIQQLLLNDAVLTNLGINPELPPVFTTKLLSIIPYTYQIVGDISKTEHLFSLLLGDPITIKAGRFSEPVKSDRSSFLGHITLGADSTAGNIMMPGHYLVQLIVGPVSKEEFSQYKDGGWKTGALQTLINFIIPIEWEMTTEIEIEKEEAKSFILNDGERTNARLGYTTSLP